MVPSSFLESRASRIIASFAPALVVLLFGGLVYAGLQSNRRNVDSVHRGQAVATELESLFAQLQAAEADVRGYLLTGDTAYAAASDAAAAAARRAFVRAEALALDAEQRQRLSELRPQVAGFTAMLDEVRAIGAAANADARALNVWLERGEEQSAALRREIDELVARQRLLLAQRAERERSQTRRVTGIVIGGTLVAGFAALLANLLLVRHAQARERATREIEERNVQLEEQAIELELQAQELEMQATELEESVAAATASEEEKGSILASVRESERRLATLLANLPGMVYRCACDPAWTMEFVSEGAMQLTGRAPDELVGPGAIGFAECIHPDDREPVWRAVDEAVAQRRPFQLEYRLITAAGDEKHVWERGHPIFDDAGDCEALEGFIMDVTEERRAQARLATSEAQLRQAQKMEAVGRLAGGIAHDFNNALGVIGGTAQLVLVEMRPDDPHRADLEVIDRAVDRAAALTRQLLAFSRQQVLQPEVLDLNQSVVDTERMLRRMLGADIEFVTDLEATPALVRVDRGQLEQVLLNLAINARDAMPHGGTLSTLTRHIELTQADVAEFPHTVEPGPYVLLSVGDTGHGMSQEVMERIFEPFFTTKEQGKGTGLGLSTVYGIVQQSGGYVAVRSTPGAGSTFLVYLPRVRSRPAQADAGPPTVPAAGGETVLLVDDDDTLRTVARRALEHAGYGVLEAASGEAALRLLERQRVDLLLTDVVMPKMSGRELSERARELHPRLQVLFTSGYTDDTILRHGVPSGAAFLQKPYRPQTLARMVAELLARG